jgi:predicted RNA methylase
MSDRMCDARAPEDASAATTTNAAGRRTARAAELVALVRGHLSGAHRVVIHDLGCGTGSMGRWVAPPTSGRQHWIMCYRDAVLLEQAATNMIDRTADGTPVTVETRRSDITRVSARKGGCRG